ncbi:serine protease [Platysternon megacephalum]|uniref:Serine protease n=1 Tax=Platysternon megacephalum TaxID=55544 RepID=A0A4D9DGL7_9SAUR|nr:serine protease [Platysternon megacephalum]
MWGGPPSREGPSFAIPEVVRSGGGRTPLDGASRWGSQQKKQGPPLPDTPRPPSSHNRGPPTVQSRVDPCDADPAAGEVSRVPSDSPILWQLSMGRGRGAQGP